MIVINSIEIVLEINGLHGYGFGKDKNLYNLKTGKRKKHTMNNYTKGWWIERKFYSHVKLKSMLKKPDREVVPF